MIFVTTRDKKRGGVLSSWRRFSIRSTNSTWYSIEITIIIIIIIILVGAKPVSRTCLLPVSRSTIRLRSILLY